jgi:hypothetical protein
MLILGSPKVVHIINLNFNKNMLRSSYYGHCLNTETEGHRIMNCAMCHFEGISNIRIHIPAAADPGSWSVESGEGTPGLGLSYMRHGRPATSGGLSVDLWPLRADLVHMVHTLWRTVA